MSRLSFLALQDTRFSVFPVMASVNRYLKLQLEYKNTDHEVTSRCDIHELRKTEDKENKRAFWDMVLFSINGRRKQVRWSFTRERAR